MIMPLDTLEFARSRQLTRLVAEGEIHRPTKVTTPTGGTSLVWTPIATGLAIGIAPGPSGQGQEQQLIVERFGGVIPWYVVIPVGQDVKPSDRIYQTAPNTRVFEVIALPNKQISFETLRRVLCVEVS